MSKARLISRINVEYRSLRRGPYVRVGEAEERLCVFYRWPFHSISTVVEHMLADLKDGIKTVFATAPEIPLVSHSCGETVDRWLCWALPNLPLYVQCRPLENMYQPALF